MSGVRAPVVLAAAVMGCAVISSARAEDQSAESKIAQLEAKVAALEATEAQNSKDVAATIDSVLRDAEHRSQLLATNGDAAAGWDNGFFIKAGEWSLKP